MGWQDEIFEAWWEDTFTSKPNPPGIGIKEIARLAFHQGWDAGEDR